MATEVDYNADYTDASIYLVKGTTLNGLKRLIKQDRPKAGSGVTTSQTTDGTTISAKGGGIGGSGDHWWYVIVNGSLYAAQFNSGPLMAAGDVPAGTVFENQP